MPFIFDQNGQWAGASANGVTDDSSAMRITYVGGGRKLWSRQ